MPLSNFLFGLSIDILSCLFRIALKQDRLQIHEYYVLMIHRYYKLIWLFG